MPTTNVTCLASLFLNTYPISGNFSLASLYLYFRFPKCRLAFVETPQTSYLLCFSGLSFTFPAAAAKSLQSCLTLCDPIDGSPPGSSVRDSPGKDTGVCCQFLLQCMHACCRFSRVWFYVTLCTAALTFLLILELLSHWHLTTAFLVPATTLLTCITTTS